MPVQPVADSPGRWADAERDPAAPGLFVVLIGVSAYRHLAGGPRPAPQTYGLPQLFTSATAAWRLFTWLRDEYTGPAPVARVWLLLSPTPAELAFTPEMATNPCEPTFEACEDAIGEWYAAMQALPKPTARESRSLFFFTGHGLEIHQEQHFLLPADFLKPPQFNVNRALATNRLRRALATLDVPNQVFFLDACRSDHAALRAQDIQGTDVLNVPGAKGVNPLLASPMFYATSAGEMAWQQRDPAQGTSIFADALLGGLRGSPGVRLQQGPQGWAVTVFPLQKFIKQRMAAIHAELGSTATQPLVLTGNVDDIDLAYVTAPPPTTAPLAFASDDDPYEELSFAETPLDPRERARLADTLEDPIVAGFLAGAQLFARQDERWSESEVPFDLVRVRRGPAPSYEIELRPRAPAQAWWLLLGHGTHAADTNAAACVLPGDVTIPTFRVEVFVGTDGAIDRLHATLAASSRGPLRLAARQWELAEQQSIHDALRAIPTDPAVLDALASTSPLAAGVAALLLLQAGGRAIARRGADGYGAWLHALAIATPGLPDPAVLDATYRLAEGDPLAARRSIALLLGRGLPWTAPGLAYTADALADLRTATPATPAAPRLDALDEPLRLALRYLRPGGLFATFSGPAAALTPALLGQS